MSKNTKKLILLILILTLLYACSPKKWVCDYDSDGFQVTTEVDTYYTVNKDNSEKNL